MYSYNLTLSLPFSPPSYHKLSEKRGCLDGSWLEWCSWLKPYTRTICSWGAWNNNKTENGLLYKNSSSVISLMHCNTCLHSVLCEHVAPRIAYSIFLFVFRSLHYCMCFSCPVPSSVLCTPKEDLLSHGRGRLNLFCPGKKGEYEYSHSLQCCTSGKLYFTLP